MAIYHLNVSIGSRSSGQSAAAKDAYIEREEKYAKGKEEVAHIEHGNMPTFAAENPREYWQAADLYERANGQLYRQIEFALPAELTLEQQIELAHDFAQHLTAAEKLPYTLAIHKGEYDHQGRLTDTPRNPHCHLIISERGNDGIERTPEKWFSRANKKNPERGGAAKTRSMAHKSWLLDTRAQWADMANAALEQHGHQSRIDHRTLEAQGITDRLPQQHHGISGHMAQRGRDTARMRAIQVQQADNSELLRLHRERHALESIPQPPPIIAPSPHRSAMPRLVDAPTLADAPTLTAAPTLSAALNNPKKSIEKGQRNENPEHDMQQLRERRSDERGNQPHGQEREPARNADLLHRPAHADMEREQPHADARMQPVERQPDRLMAEMRNKTASQVEATWEECKRILESLQGFRRQTEYGEKEAQKRLATLEKLRKEAVEARESLSGAFLGKWRHKSTIKEKNAEIRRLEREIRENTEKIAEAPAELAKYDAVIQETATKEARLRLLAVARTADELRQTAIRTLRPEQVERWQRWAADIITDHQHEKPTSVNRKLKQGYKDFLQAPNQERNEFKQQQERARQRERGRGFSR